MRSVDLKKVLEKWFQWHYFHQSIRIPQIGNRIFHNDSSCQYFTVTCFGISIALRVNILLHAFTYLTFFIFLIEPLIFFQKL